MSALVLRSVYECGMIQQVDRWIKTFKDKALMSPPHAQ